MGEQGLLVGEQKVMAGKELVGLGEAEVAADEVGERAANHSRCRNHSLPGAISHFRTGETLGGQAAEGWERLRLRAVPAALAGQGS